MDRIVKELGNGLAAAGIPGQQTIAAYVSLDAMNVKLSPSILHNSHHFVKFDGNSIAHFPRFCKYYTKTLHLLRVDAQNKQPALGILRQK